MLIVNISFMNESWHSIRREVIITVHKMEVLRWNVRVFQHCIMNISRMKTILAKLYTFCLTKVCILTTSIVTSWTLTKMIVEWIEMDLCANTIANPIFWSRNNLLGDDCAENIFVITARWLMQQNKGSHAACSIMNKHIYSRNYHWQLLRTLQNKICEKMFPQFSSFSLHHITATWRVHLEFPPSTGGFNWGHWIKDFLVLIRGYSLPPPPNV